MKLHQVLETLGFRVRNTAARPIVDTHNVMVTIQVVGAKKRLSSLYSALWGWVDEDAQSVVECVPWDWGNAYGQNSNDTQIVERAIPCDTVEGPCACGAWHR